MFAIEPRIQPRKGRAGGSTRCVIGRPFVKAMTVVLFSAIFVCSRTEDDAKIMHMAGTAIETAGSERIPEIHGGIHGIHAEIREIQGEIQEIHELAESRGLTSSKTGDEGGRPLWKLLRD
jgi:hypothetical protein